MEESILTSTKKNLGLATDYTAFDHDVQTYINLAFSTLTDLGIGPSAGFMIDGPDETWASYTTDITQQSAIRTYVYLKAKTMFDPPANSYLVEAMDKQIEEVQWRILARREATDWTDPDPDTEAYSESNGSSFDLDVPGDGTFTITDTD